MTLGDLVDMAYVYFKFEGATEGTWPADHPIQAGAIVRQSAMLLHALPTTAYNHEMNEWAIGKWVTTTNPALAVVGSTPEGQSNG